MSQESENVVQLPRDWKSAFQGSAMKSSFCLALTQPMLEFLCATADGVHWDRRLYYRDFGIARPDNWMASSASLEKRGLVERLSKPELSTIDAMSRIAHYRLTPAGVAVVDLLKIAGIFVQADAALEKSSG